jgi:predicted exporter
MSRDESTSDGNAGDGPGWRRHALGALWLLLLLAAGLAASQQLRVSGDLRAFMPAPRDDDQRLMLSLLGDGPGSRLLLLALSGAEPEDLAEHSRALRERLAEAPELAWAGNGEDDLEQIPEVLHDYRYLLSDGPASGSLEAGALATALQERLRDLASPAAAMIAPLLARDPTLETLRVLQAWTPASEPERFDGVWVTRAGDRALLLVQTRAAGFDPVGQQAALQAIREAYAALDGAPSGGLEISGPGAFAERMAQQTQTEATRLGTAASVALLLLLALAYRSLSRPLHGALPLATGGVAGLLAVGAMFDLVHGITLAFGFTLLGVAQDYPVHLFSHARPRESLLQTARHIWPTLAAGTGSSCLAYAVFLFAGVEGLRQLAVFTVVGLSVASLTTRYALPRVAPAIAFDAADAGWPRQLQRLLLRRAWPRWPAWLLALLGLAALLLPAGPWWQDDLATLTPIPPQLLQRDRELRAELGAPDVRWLLLVPGADTEAVLQRSEALQPTLDAAVASGVLAGYDQAARYLPSARTQRARQEALPDAAALRARLAQAQSGLPFAEAAFEPFLAAVERARALPTLRAEALRDTPLQLRVEALLRPHGTGMAGLVSLSGVQQPEALRALLAAQPGLRLLDLKSTAQSLAGTWRTRLLAAMTVAWIALCLGIGWSVRSVRRAGRVLLPVALGTLLVVASLHAAAVPLTLFHLVSLVLSACLGVDYSLFLERAGSDPVAQRRTLHALAICAFSTLLVFALLGTSQTPVLRAIGLTVSLGVLLQIFLSALLTAHPTASGDAPP